jgi:hypothetical protein
MDFDIQPNNFSPSRTPVITLVNQTNRKLTSSITPSIVDSVHPSKRLDYFGLHIKENYNVSIII